MIITSPAARDLRRRERHLGLQRGTAFARQAVDAMLVWFEKLADEGAQLGTAAGDDPAIRSFGYGGQATVIARFSPAELRVLRVYFKGQDWSRGPRGR